MHGRKIIMIKEATYSNSVKNKLQWLLALLFLFIMPYANAEYDLTGMYYGVQYSAATSKYELSTGDVNTNYGHLKLKVGKVIKDDYFVEGHVGTVTTSNLDSGVLTYGAYLRANKDIEEYKLYGVLGLGGILNYESENDDNYSSNASWGFGVEVKANKNMSLTFEYLTVVNSSLNDNPYKFETLGFGYTYYFHEEKSFFKKNRKSIKNIRDN